MRKSFLDSVPEGFLAFCWFNMPPSARARVLAKAGKTVWIFGAGASHHYDLNRFGVPVPLASGFFEAFNALPTSQGFNAHVGPLISFLEHYRGVAPQDVHKWNENIEDFMTSIDNKLEELRTKKQKRRLTRREFADAVSFGTSFNNMNFLFANVVNEAQNGASVSLYHTLLKTCGPNDAFITFNWDTLLDRALTDTGGWHPNNGYGVKFASALDGTWKPAIEGSQQFETQWKLLKLHGSTNWLVPYLGVDWRSLEYVSIVPESDRVFLYWHSNLSYPTHKGRWRGGYVPTCYCYYPPNIPGGLFSKEQISAGPGKAFLSFTPRLFSPFSESADPGVSSSPLLITPVRQKRYDMYASTIGNLWKQAQGTLATADRIVIVGYSFPPTDVRAIKLLKAALKNRSNQIDLEIVAPGVADIVSRIGTKVVSQAKSVNLLDMKFDEYLGLISQRIPQMMTAAATRSKDVRNWLRTVYGLSLGTAEQRRKLHEVE